MIREIIFGGKYIAIMIDSKKFYSTLSKALLRSSSRAKVIGAVHFVVGHGMKSLKSHNKIVSDHPFLHKSTLTIMSH